MLPAFRVSSSILGGSFLYHGLREGSLQGVRDKNNQAEAQWPNSPFDPRCREHCANIDSFHRGPSRFSRLALVSTESLVRKSNVKAWLSRPEKPGVCLICSKRPAMKSQPNCLLFFFVCLFFLIFPERLFMTRKTLVFCSQQ